MFNVKKRGIIFSVLLTLTLAGCGMSYEEKMENVKNYRIFDGDTDGMRTVGDFVEQMEDLEEEGDEVGIFVVTLWGDSEESILLGRPKEDENFDYDRKKHYVELSVMVEAYSVENYDTIGEGGYGFLFSIDKEGNVAPEASASFEGHTYDYQDIDTNSANVELSMEESLILYKVMKSMYVN